MERETLRAGVRAYDGQWSSWAEATITETGPVQTTNESVAYNQSVALNDIFNVLGELPAATSCTCAPTKTGNGATGLRQR
jgi:hypothetical protein